MKANIYFFIVSLCLMFCACNSGKKEESQTKLYEPTEEITVVDPVERGEFLVNAVGCHDCHTPKKMTPEGMTLDFDRLLSGHPSEEELPAYDAKTAQSYILLSMGLTAATGPWGTSFAANLTPDATGIDSWSEAQFLKAIKEGKYKGLDGGRPLLPPMPWQSLKSFPDEDLKAMFAYLKSIKPVENVVPSAILAEAPPQ